MSSFSEQYLEELVRDKADTNAALSNYIFGSSLAFRTYLIDALTGPGGAVTGFQSLVPISTGVIQRYDATMRGGYHEIALGLAGNMADKLYVWKPYHPDHQLPARPDLQRNGCNHEYHK
jgi:hypothetical protein